MLPKIMPKNFPSIKQKNTSFVKIYPEQGFKLQFDGCSKSNPGLSGAGAVIYYNDGEVWSDSLFVGENNTNNQAEYAGLLLGLKRASDMDIKSLRVEGDSLLVINQMKGHYKCSSSNLFELYQEAKSLLLHFDSIHFNHIYRNENKRADQLSNIAVEKYIQRLALEDKF
jgi:ribonuclease HI